MAGLPTNADFLRRITLNAEFGGGAVDTAFIARHEAELLAPEALDPGENQRERNPETYKP